LVGGKWRDKFFILSLQIQNGDRSAVHGIKHNALITSSERRSGEVLVNEEADGLKGKVGWGKVCTILYTSCTKYVQDGKNKRF